MKHKKHLIVSLTLAASLALTAASVQFTFARSNASPARIVAHIVELPPIEPDGLSGEIKIGGSPAAYPLTRKIADDFIAEGFQSDLSVVSEDSASGTARFCAGEIDVVDMDRPMLPAEIEACEKNDRAPVEFKIGTDAVIFAVSRRNRFVDGLTNAQVRQIFSGKAKTWKEVNPNWPATNIRLYSPPKSSASYQYVTDRFFTGVVTDVVPANTARDDIIARATGIVLTDSLPFVARSVYSDVFALTTVSYAFYSRNRAMLRTVPFDGVMANDRTLPSGEYPLTRPLFIAVAEPDVKDKPQVAAFVNYYLANVNHVIGDAGYFAETDKALDETKTRWLNLLK
jgi:phosphate binding protein